MKQAIRSGILLPLVFSALSLIAQQKTRITLQSGKLPEGVKVSLRKEWPVRKLVDTGFIKNGNLVFTVTDSLPAVYSLNTRNPWMNAAILLEGPDVTVKFDQPEPIVEAGPSQQALSGFLASIKPFEEQWREIGNRYSAAKDMEEKLTISKEMDVPAEKVMGGRERFVIEHAGDLAGIWMAHEQLNLWREPALVKMIPLFRSQTRTAALASQLQGKLDELNTRRMTGNKAPFFRLPDIKGNEVELDSVIRRNKYVLIDIWASWCAPCRATNRKLAPEYAALKQAGIEVISISVDEKKSEWEKAVAVDMIPWTQLISPEGMKSKVVADYKVQSLPATFLIDQQGNIIRQHVSIEELKSPGGMVETTSILLSNGIIIDGDAAVKPRKGSVLIENGVITRISYGKTIPVSNDVHTVDCTGKYITPGMMDAHVHLGTSDLSDPVKARRVTDSILYNMVRHGITTVRDMAGDARFLKQLRTAAVTTNLYSPEIYYAAQFAGPEYFRMMSNGRKGQDEGGNFPWARSIADTSDLPKAIAEAKAWGATGIKIYAELSAALVTNITKEAYKQGLLAWSHASVNPALPADIAAAAVNSMSHANDLVFQQFPAGTSLSEVWEAIYKGLKADSVLMRPILVTMKNNRIYFDPTLFHGASNNMKNAAVIARWAHRTGVLFVAGTDWIYPSTNAAVPLLDEMKHLVSDAGLSNAEAIQAATMNAAAVTGLKDRGLVRKGMQADLLILNADPLKALDALFVPQTVIRKGQILHFAGKFKPDSNEKAAPGEAAFLP
ncbi:MAG: amidohydrolase family protein [Pseudobacter sp.]|uniref:amidohydrolase family protein n=1 Tax=Pseudobacter sp. TaxID=2045420 RepID=UPI003F816CF3